MEKIAFTFWDGPQLSLLNIISILSFAKLNLDTQLIIYTLDGSTDVNISWSTGEHSNKILKQFNIRILDSEPNISIKKVNQKTENKIASSIQLADYIRIQKLFEHGGIWIDADILFFEKIPDWIWDTANLPGFVISYFNTITTGFLGFKEGSLVTELALKKANSVLSSNEYQKDYQSLGPDLWKMIFLENPNELKDVEFLSDKIIYPIIWEDLNHFYFENRMALLHDETIGIHWYNGSVKSRSFINNNLEYFLQNPGEQTTFQVCMKILDQKTNILTSIKEIMAKHHQIAA